MKFTLSPGSPVDEFLAADRALQVDFAYRQPGLLRRTTARAADGTWIVVDLWRAAADADACAARWDGDPVVARFMSYVDGPSVVTERYAELD